MDRIALNTLKCGCAKYWANEARDAMYRIATKLVRESWGRPAEVADGLGVVLLTWNQAAYRYGSFDFDELELFLERNATALDSFRNRPIRTFDPEKEADTVKSLFNEALEALAFTDKKRKTPVGVAKSLHLLAPGFFPLWDKEIAKACRCDWHVPSRSAANYIAFMEQVQAAVASLEAQFAKNSAHSKLPSAPDLAGSLSQLAGRPKTMLKLLDEYFYAKYTKRWI